MLYFSSSTACRSLITSFVYCQTETETLLYKLDKELGKFATDLVVGHEALD